MLFLLAKSDDYIKNIDDIIEFEYCLNPKKNFPLLDGYFCNKPEDGAVRYNNAILEHSESISTGKTKNRIKLDKLISSYPKNRRIKKIKVILEDKVIVEDLTPFEIILFSCLF